MKALTIRPGQRAARSLELFIMEAIPMILLCPNCSRQHVDKPSDGWRNPPHRSHLCAYCGAIWRPCDLPTTGVQTISTKGKADTYNFTW
jgi:hypothetical protein